MIRIIDARTSYYTFGELDSGTPFFYNKDLYIKTDTEYTAILVFTGELEHFENDETVEPTCIEIKATDYKL